MKRLKKLMAVLLAAGLLMSMSMAAFAADGGNQIIISSTSEKHVYKAYQIFDGSLSDDGETLTDITWGSGIDTEKTVGSKTFLQALQAANSGRYGSCKTAADVAKALSSVTDNSDGVKEFAEIAADYLTGTPVEGSFSEGTYTISGLDDGYYLVSDQDSNLAENEAYSSYIVQTAGANTTIASKHDIPTSQKKIKDINDSTELQYTDWQDSADYDIGDSIPFQLTATLPDNYSEYDTYSMTFHDTEANGLSFKQDSVEVFVDNTKITQGYDVITDGLNDGCTFEIRFADLKTADQAMDEIAITKDSIIRVEYESVLNDQAVIGSVGNRNDMYLTYSNNPYGEGTGTTPLDTVIVFTYQTIIHKKNEENGDLTGATFTLEKEIKGETENRWETVGTVIGTVTSVFTFTGLDDGNYRITEAAAPDGYNKIDPVYFTITAEHETVVNAGDVPQLTTLTGTEFANPETGTVLGLTFTRDTGNQDSLTADIKNFPGSILPGTGGMGTTVFYIVGIALVAGAAAVITVRIKKARR